MIDYCKKSQIQKFPSQKLTTQTRWIVSSSDESYDVELLRQVRLARNALDEAENGLAVAANQASFIENPLRFFVIRPSFAEKNSLPQVVFNPSFSIIGKPTDNAIEGCLSFPGLEIMVPRHKTIVAQFWDGDWKSHAVALAGLAGRMFQHECEHLDGETFLKQMPRVQRFQVMARFKKSRGI